MKKCDICKKEYKGHGHNAEPLSTGRCCDKCNQEVIKKRISDLKK